MRKAEIYRNNNLAGLLIEKNRNSYVFRYNDDYFNDTSTPPISLTLPKIKQEHHGDCLFPCFFNILSEGANKILQCRRLKIDEKDNFGLLVAIASMDTIGALTVKGIE